MHFNNNVTNVKRFTISPEEISYLLFSKEYPKIQPAVLGFWDVKPTLKSLRIINSNPIELFSNDCRNELRDCYVQRPA